MSKSLGEEVSSGEALKKVREIVKDLDFCMLTTISDSGTLHSRPMSSNGEIDGNGTIWFFSNRDTLKTHEVSEQPQVNLSFASPDKNEYVSISGTAELVDDREKIKELWKPSLKAWFPQGETDPSIVLLKVSSNSLEFWDGTASVVAHAFSFAKGMLTGKPGFLGTHGTAQK